MALIKCPKCSAIVSDSAQNCPNCGYPLNRRYRPKTQEDFNTWYYEFNGQAVRITERVLLEKIRNRDISPDTLVVNSEIKQWTPLKNTQLYINNCTVPVQVVNSSQAEDSSGTATIAIIALVLAFVSLFVFPLILAVISIILSIISYGLEKKGLIIATTAILVSLISVPLNAYMGALLAGFF